MAMKFTCDVCGRDAPVNYVTERPPARVAAAGREIDLMVVVQFVEPNANPALCRSCLADAMKAAGDALAKDQ